MGSSKGGSAPATPDYTGAAKATAQGNIDAARIATKANRVDTYTPYGSITYSQGNSNPTFNQSAYDQAVQQYNSNPVAAKSGARPPNPADYYTAGDPDSWSANISLSPDQQQLLDQNQQLSIGSGNLANSVLGNLNSTMGSRLNSISQSYDPAQWTNRATELLNSRLLPQQEKDRAALESRLANQGISLGSDAYRDALTQMGQTQNDARLQNELAGIDLGMKQQQQNWTQNYMGLNNEMDLLNQLRAGSQVTNPTFPNFANQATTGGADYMGATNAGYNSDLNSYNAKQASSSNMMNGLLSAALTAAMIPKM